MKNIFKKSISIFLTLLMLVSIAPTSVITYAGDVVDTGDGITWTFDGKTLVISGSGEVSYIQTNDWYDEIWDKCETVIVEEGITSIGEGALAELIVLEKVEILGDITQIGEWAFYGCPKLKEINIPDSVTVIGDRAFGNCPLLEPINIPENVIEIGEWAFENCSAFKNWDLILPATIQKVSLGAFSGTQIKSITTPFLGVGPTGADYTEMYSNHVGYMFGDEQYSNSYAAYDSVSEKTYYLPKSLKTVTLTKQINNNNFENAEGIENIIIKGTVETTEYPDNFAKNCKSLKSVLSENTYKITRIGSYAFFSCVGLENFVIPENVAEIDTSAFGYCEFSGVQLPESLKTIGVRAFENCLNITSIVIPDSTETIDSFAFGGCSNLVDVTVQENLPGVHKYAFKGAKYEYNNTSPEEDDDFVVTTDGTLIAYFGTDENIVVPDGVKQIGKSFANKEFIKSITLPDTLEAIDRRAFDNCKGIKELVVPESVTVIEKEAFAGMCNLTKLTVPFIGRTRNVKTDTEEALLGYWFSTYNDHDCMYNCFSSLNAINQYYDDDYYFYRSYKPRCFTELTVTDGILRSNVLNDYGITILHIGANVAEIEEYFAYNLALEELTFDENIKLSNITDNTFTKNKLTSIVIPKSVRRLGNAFSNNLLEEIVLNEGLEIIDGSFINARVTSIDFPDSLTEIGMASFKACPYLESVVFPKNLKKIGEQAFQLNRKLTEVVFSNSITDIGGSSFSYCSVKKVVIPEGMQAIVEFAFRYCDALEIVVIGGKVEEIGAQTFADCPSLETVVIPDSVTYISTDAFENASENMVIYCNEGSYAQAYAIQNNIKYTTLVLDSIPNQTYTGKEIKPEVGAKANNRPLTLNTEYKLSYSNNINVGVAGITAKGLGDFKHLVAKGQFNILACQLKNITVKYEDFTIYSPDGIKVDLALYMGNDLLTEGKDYEIIGLDKVTGVGTYNIAVKGTGNVSGSKNFTLDVLPRSITETRVSSGDGVKVTYSGCTLVEGIDYKLEKRTTESGELETYVVGIGNYTDEKRVGSTGDSLGTNILYRIMAIFEKLFAAIRDIFS